MFSPGQLKRIIVLGSGPVGLRLATVASGLGIAVEVFLAERQRDDTNTEGESVVSGYRAQNVAVTVVNDIRGCVGGPYETAADDTLLFSLGSPYIIRKDLIDLYKGRAINSHGAPLPEWRGGGGFSWRMLANDRRGNTCFHLIEPGIDQGDIVFQRAYSFPPEARFPRDWMAIADQEACDAISEFIPHLHNGGRLSRQSQDEAQASYFPRLHTPSQALIDWSWEGAEIERFVLAFSYPYAGARTFLADKEVNIMDCTVDGETRYAHPFLAGLVYRVHDGYAYVAAGRSSLRMPLEHLRCDRTLREGDRFHTPPALLAEARAYRPVYTGAGLKGPSAGR